MFIWQIWRRFEAVASAAHEAGNQIQIAIEWPRSCAYWKQDCVKQLLRKCGLQAVKVDGCAFGMVDPEGTPVLKPWTIATNDAALAQNLACRCLGHEHHARIAGRITAGIANYPENMAKTIHHAWRDSIRQRCASGEIRAVPAVPDGKTACAATGGKSDSAATGGRADSAVLGGYGPSDASSFSSFNNLLGHFC